VAHFVPAVLLDLLPIKIKCQLNPSQWYRFNRLLKQLRGKNGDALVASVQQQPLRMLQLLLYLPPSSLQFPTINRRGSGVIASLSRKPNQQHHPLYPQILNILLLTTRMLRIRNFNLTGGADEDADEDADVDVDVDAEVAVEVRVRILLNKLTRLLQSLPHHLQVLHFLHQKPSVDAVDEGEGEGEDAGAVSQWPQWHQAVPHS